MPSVFQIICRRLFLLLLVVFISLVCPDRLTAATYTVRGVSGEVKKNVEQFLASATDPQSGELGRYREQLKKASLQSLQAFGYYDPVIGVQVKKHNDTYDVEVDISVGQPVRVTQLDLQMLGSAEQDPEFQRIISDLPLQVGDSFHHGIYEELKARFTDLAASRGYFDAQWQTAKVEISIKEKSAGLTLVFVSRERYRFGEVMISGAPKLHELIRANQPFKTGELYSAKQMADYNLKLSDSNFFRTILVRPDLENRAAGVVPITIQATPFASHIVSAGGGYSTDVGVRGTLKWRIPLLNKAGHSLETGMEVSSPEQTLAVSYKLPLEDANENFALLQAGYQHRNNGDTDSRKYTLQAKRQRVLTNGWERSCLLRYELEDFRQGAQRDQSSLILPGLSFTRERSRGGLNVNWGDRLQFYLEVSDPVWGSDARFARFQGRSKLVRTSGERNDHKFILRADIGAIAVESISDVPASLRFFTGGDQSVRGFSYESIAPRDENGLFLGGKYLAVGSLEYAYLLREKWRVASFIDVGTATNDFSESPSIGSGIGLRWLTPVGPLRIDLAFALSEPRKPWMIHFSMGPDI
jgi:translocation and assembly module TamA